MSVNVDRMLGALDFAEKSEKLYGEQPIETHLKKGVITADDVDPATPVWDQTFWVQPVYPPGVGRAQISEDLVPLCGTAYCIAGWVVSQLPGYTEEVKLNGAGYAHVETYINGERVVVRDAAQDALGITWADADLLFDANNSLEDVRRVIESIIERDAGE